MTPSRHTQVENLTNLLGARRAQARRDNAYLLLTASILVMPVEDVVTRLKRSVPAERILSFPAHHTRGLIPGLRATRFGAAWIFGAASVGLTS